MDNQSSGMSFVKLSQITDFTLQKVRGFQFKMWDGQGMVTSPTWQQGFSKKWTLETNKGIVDVSDGAMSSILVACFDKVKSEPVGRTFQVKTNGKTGMEIRYYFSLVDVGLRQYQQREAREASDFNVEDIPM